MKKQANMKMDNSVEILIMDNKPIMAKTDNKGIIEYVNEYFSELSGYEIYELIGKQIDFIKHPDMPKIIYNYIWKNITTKKNSTFVLKCISKSGAFFWLKVTVNRKKNEADHTENIYLHYSKLSNSVINEFQKLYKTIKDLEIHSSDKIAENYFLGTLEEKSQDFNEFMDSYF